MYISTSSSLPSQVHTAQRSRALDHIHLTILNDLIKSSFLRKAIIRSRCISVMITRGVVTMWSRVTIEITYPSQSEIASSPPNRQREYLSNNVIDSLC